MSRPRSLEDITAASAALVTARQSLADAKFLARNGMANNLTFATSVEITAYHRWLRAHAVAAAQ